MATTKTIDWATRRRLAVEGSVDPRTVEKILRGEYVRGLAGHRARATLAAAGIQFPAPGGYATRATGVRRSRTARSGPR